MQINVETFYMSHYLILYGNYVYDASLDELLVFVATLVCAMCDVRSMGIGSNVKVNFDFHLIQCLHCYKFLQINIFGMKSTPTSDINMNSAGHTRTWEWKNAIDSPILYYSVANTNTNTNKKRMSTNTFFRSAHHIWTENFATVKKLIFNNKLHIVLAFWNFITFNVSVINLVYEIDISSASIVAFH